MKKANGFTLIELMTAVVFIGIIATIIMSVFSNTHETSWGFNGMTETRCIRGYEFVVGANGSTQQVLNAQGGGVQCK
jgi:prepilin-type N-terminal cleavage/methylation domain-containing protein